MSEGNDNNNKDNKDSEKPITWFKKAEKVARSKFIFPLRRGSVAVNPHHHSNTNSNKSTPRSQRGSQPSTPLHQRL